MTDEEFQDEQLRAWVNDPITRLIAAGYAKQVEVALVSLISAARMSPDPKVMRAVTQYEDALVISEAMKKGPTT